MKTVAAISDSIENSIYDPGRSVITIKDMQLDPVVMVSRVYDGDGEFESIDVSEIIDAAFSECDVAAVSVGYLTDDSVISYLAGKLSSGEHAPVVARPSMISDDGDILVGRVVAEGQPQTALCKLAGKSHREEYVRRLGRARSAG